MDADGETTAAIATATSDEIGREAEENRKEALLASTLSLQPNFNRSNVSQKQISKLQELHKRRMQIKAKSNIHKKKPKGKKNSPSRGIENGESSKQSTSSPSTLDMVPKKKPQKLFWGLDTRERWERKANM